MIASLYPEPAALPPLWPHQERTPGLVAEQLRAGRRAVVVTTPTGGGKLRVMVELARRATEKGRRVGLFTNRRILTRQTSGALEAAGLGHGFVAAGYPRDAWRDVQILSLPTVAARCLAGPRTPLPPLDLVLVDEAHGCKAETGQAVVGHYKAAGAAVVGFTATPVGLAGLYDALVRAGTPSELRRCGALVPCDVFAPSEPDMRGVKLTRDGEFQRRAAAKRCMETLAFGDTFREWERLNPWRRPTVLWAPGVAESRWFAEQFQARGVKAAHLDGDTADAERDDLFAASQAGDLPVLCSCGVLREGVDLPWLEVGVLVQPCAALSTFLQIAGRLLRACPGKERATLIDQAGAFWRHGSPNADREWRLEDGDRQIAKRLRRERQEGREREPIRCPKCSGVRAAGPECPHCGHRHVKSVRQVRMLGGEMHRVIGDTVKKAAAKTADQKLWASCLYAAAASNRTVEQAALDFRRRCGRSAHAGLQPRPDVGGLDWKRRCDQVFPWLLKRRQKA